jgi:hypothetical protein|uniref:Thioredoxin domain-containing protein n=1 Tax=Eutreptiella gymnastica TaxID=73025 RepID=A0A7S4GHZ2_9EUGL|eukprot:CAMPEP_0174289270 /NCGR_PEP_ID=MMETSP0809-20121228/24393_1 /TAXON_ID=73025 ORGANISM="Eutreptiella gymnastica-like, Strain CCMP1594" /NCGR_SAMPLE_ID=MMETSP0809 /ASSEMBLY_ACC=CAM_ASM_000658 /LENGTH=164 /DNA_ID=CAMNT_0015387129 /DNA_START=53 /DNA_END=547 /DNA_ORIENTATION=+
MGKLSSIRNFFGKEAPNKVNGSTIVNPVELGDVAWHRDLDTALMASTQTGKPVFCLFQEIPGCSTCTGFGSNVLRNPALVRSIQTDFIPVAIHNNKPGRDAQVLKRYGEPSWNNPVVRFLDGDGRDILPRRDGVWTAQGIASRMVEALCTMGLPVPEDVKRIGM